MRYTASHKQETHQRLLNVAAEALREKGPERLAVADVMRAAGLTHGGFYAHFKSKDALLAETLAAGFAQSARRMRRLVDGLPPRHALATWIDQYVSPHHRDNRSTGCPIVALSSDLPRQSKKFQAAFDKGVKAMIRQLESWMAESGMDEPERLAESVLSAAVGAVSMSRAVSDKRLSDDLLEAARANIKARLALGDAALSNEAQDQKGGRVS